jgi:uncharacterized membrane protein
MTSNLQRSFQALLVVGLALTSNIVSARSQHFGFSRGPLEGFFSMLMFLFLLGLFIAVIVYLFRFLSTQQTSAQTSSVQPPADSAMALLRERLAKGKIDVEDFEARKQVLLSE